MTLRKKILHVDDDERALRMTSLHLEKEGFEVVSTTSPFVSHIIQQERPDLILMDVDMPLLTGDKIVSILRSHGYTGVPVIFFSAQPANVLASLAEQLPRSAYVLKDRGLGALVERIRQILPS